MNKITERTIADLDFELTWKSEIGSHREVYFAQNVNFWRDLLSRKVAEALTGTFPGDHKHHSFSPGDLVAPFDAKKKFALDHRQFERRRINGHRIEPRFGRFYPKGLLKNLPNIYSTNMDPFRCVGVESTCIEVDFNHPLAKQELELRVTVRDVRKKGYDRGGSLTDWMETLTNGPGMQIRCQGRSTDFFSDHAFSRSNEEDDTLFYVKPRLVTHTDADAEEKIRALYGKLLRPGMKVLDLMSSWRSHVPEGLALGSLVGLGLNIEEMEKNPQITRHVVHDLNTDPRMPFEDEAFDAVICTVSVEYMVRPMEVFQDVARLLKPRGCFLQTFSNRWFPPKAIKIWEELGEFERMGLVLEYFLQAGAYDNLETYSARGWPRPVTDRYYPEIATADPVYAVWGQKIVGSIPSAKHI